MRRNVFLFACGTLAAALTGCTGSPVHYHTLVSARAFDHPNQARADFELHVLPVKVPPSLDQAYLAVRKGATEIVFIDGERWASPLGSEIRAALSAELVRRLNADDTADFAASAGKPVVTLKVEIRQLDVWPGSRVQLVAGWQAAFSDRKDLALTCVTYLRESVNARDYVSLVQAEQAVLEKLADLIGTNVAALRRAASTRCGGVP